MACLQLTADRTAFLASGVIASGISAVVASARWGGPDPDADRLTGFPPNTPAPVDHYPAAAGDPR